jgi:hypothetical protein
MPRKERTKQILLIMSAARRGDLKHAERYTPHKGIYPSGEGKADHRHELDPFQKGMVIISNTFVHHFYANDHKDQKRDPVIIQSYQPNQQETSRPPGKRHSHLKETEIDRGDCCRSKKPFLGGCLDYQRDCQAVH